MSTMMLECFFDDLGVCIGCDGREWQGKPYRGKYIRKEMFSLPDNWNPIGQTYDNILDTSAKHFHSRGRY